MVKQVLKQMAEHKRHLIQHPNTNPAPVGTPTSLATPTDLFSGIVVGDGIAQRIGWKIRVTSIQIDYVIKADMAAMTGSNVLASVIVWKNKENYLGTPVYADFEYGRVMDHHQWTVKTLRRRMIGNSDHSTTPATWRFRKTFRFKGGGLPVEYNANTGEPKVNRWLMTIFHDSLISSPSAIGSIRVNYIDV